MIESFQILATLAAAQVASAMVPGPNTPIVLHAGTHGRRVGLAAAAGIWPVGFLFAAAGLAGLGALLTGLPELAEAMRIVCGLHLLVLGGKAIHRSFAEPAVATAVPVAAMTPRHAFRAAVLTNVTDPKSIAYYLSIFVATDAAALPKEMLAVALVMMPTLSLLWYATLALLVSSRPVGAVADRGRSGFERLAGLAMVGLGARLLASRG